MISIIIPAFNEESRLGKSLDKLAAFLKTRKEKFEVIVVDDASTDKTGRVAERCKKKIPNLKVVRLDKSPFAGKGLAVNKGILEAKGEVTLFTDADFSTPIEEVDKLLEKLEEGADIAIGSRALDRSLVKTRQNPLRELMGRIFNILVRALTVRGIMDTQCGFKAFKMSTCKNLFGKQRVFDFGFDVELLYLARKNELKIAEVPVVWYNNPSSKVRPIRDSLAMFADLLKIRMYYAQKHSPLPERIFHYLYQHRTFVRFAIVGASGTVVDYSLFFILTRLILLPPLVANPIAVEAAIIWNFAWNNRWTFSGREIAAPTWKRFVIFQFVSLGGLLLSQNSLFIFNRFLGILDLLAKALTIPIIAVFNYIVNSRWTFRDISRGRAMWYVYTSLIFALLLFYVLLINKI